MEIYLSPDYAEDIISIARKWGVDAQIIGRVEAGDKNKLTIVKPDGKLIFN